MNRTSHSHWAVLENVTVQCRAIVGGVSIAGATVAHILSPMGSICHRSNCPENGAIVAGAFIMGAIIAGAIIAGAIIAGAIIAGAIVVGVNFAGAIVAGVNFVGAFVAEQLSQEQLSPEHMSDILFFFYIQIFYSQPLLRYRQMPTI